MEAPQTYRVSANNRAPLVRFMCEALEAGGCRVLRSSRPDTAPFRISFESPEGVRMGIVAYAFLANSRVTKNRPDDEWRFQIKYGKRTGTPHDLWEDPYGLYTTIFVGINPEHGFFVGADPVLNSPTRFFISKEFKAEHVGEVKAKGWAVWERERRLEGSNTGFEVMVGGKAESFYRYVLFEQEAKGEDQGTRHLLAERFRDGIPLGLAAQWLRGRRASSDRSAVTALVAEFALPEADILEIIGEAPRLKVAVRGWVAERHLLRMLQATKGVSDLVQLETDGSADFSLRFEGRGPVLVECKNVLRNLPADGVPRLDFQRTRAAKGNPCSRYYCQTDFQVTAACLHSVTESWEYRAQTTREMLPHPTCEGRLHHRVRIDEAWSSELPDVFARAVEL